MEPIMRSFLAACDFNGELGSFIPTTARQKTASKIIGDRFGAAGAHHKFTRRAEYFCRSGDACTGGVGLSKRGRCTKQPRSVEAVMAPGAEQLTPVRAALRGRPIPSVPE